MQKMKQRLILKNDCWSSAPSVQPKNWKTGNKDLLKKDWRIQYYFHDPAHAAEYPYGKQVRVKGMNAFKTLKERRAATQFLLDEVRQILEEENYNPITKRFMNAVNIHNTFTFISALEFALTLKQVSKGYYTNLESTIKFTKKAAINLGLLHENIKNIKRKDIKAVLRHQQMTRNISNHRYNKFKALLGSLFDVLLEEEIIENNPTYRIKKLPETKKIREVLTADQRNAVDKHLQKNNYSFWRFMMIYYKSGARVSELLQLKCEDVDLINKEFKVYIKKGGIIKQVKKPINNTVLKLWVQLLKDVDVNDVYVFSKGLVPGANAIRYEQITRRWKVHVKDKLNITADFASLTHLYADQLAAELDVNHAAKLRSHTTTRMMQNHYAVNEKQRVLQRLKNIDIGFAVKKENNLEVG